VIWELEVQRPLGCRRPAYPRICLRRPVKKGEQLTLDYGKRKYFSADDDAGFELRSQTPRREPIAKACFWDKWRVHLQRSDNKAYVRRSSTPGGNGIDVLTDIGVGPRKRRRLEGGAEGGSAAADAGGSAAADAGGSAAAGAAVE